MIICDQANHKFPETATLPSIGLGETGRPVEGGWDPHSGRNPEFLSMRK